MPNINECQSIYAAGCNSRRDRLEAAPQSGSLWGKRKEGSPGRAVALGVLSSTLPRDRLGTLCTVSNPFLPAFPDSLFGSLYWLS